MFGLGLGPSQHFVRSTFESFIIRTSPGDTVATRTTFSNRYWGAAATAQLQLGYSFSRRWQLYFLEFDELRSETRAYSSGNPIVREYSVSGLGADLHPGKTGDPWFLSGAVGRGTIANRGGSGFAALAGVGRDLGRVAQLRLTLSYGRPANADFHQDHLAAALLVDLARR